jgi:hypothetical protein
MKSIIGAKYFERIVKERLQAIEFSTVQNNSVSTDSIALHLGILRQH